MPAARIHALFVLAWAFVVMLLKKVFGTGPRGIALFRANFEAEHLSSLTSAERAELPSLSRCIACGRCNAGDGERIAASKGAFPGTMGLMVASSRGLPDFVAANEALQWISDEDLARKEAVCPTKVPMRRVAAFIRAHAE
jgi:succinate dehydrogenase/fumarate reductase-like Fe-S protein